MIMHESPMAWMMEPWAQVLLLAAGVFASWKLWSQSGKPVQGLWSISWRMYITAILTAGIPWFGGGEPVYILYWTMLPQGLPFKSEADFASYVVIIGLLFIYWFAYLLLFFWIRFVLADPDE